jgi:hypothetical protein
LFQTKSFKVYGERRGASPTCSTICSNNIDLFLKKQKSFSKKAISKYFSKWWSDAKNKVKRRCAEKYVIKHAFPIEDKKIAVFPFIFTQSIYYFVMNGLDN